ncbi:MAG: ComF family protein [Lachnospiraceae bacterium]|nr:ComF family protein [Lachnospiraceae bacterium]
MNRIKEKGNKIFSVIQDLVFPRRCVVCDEITDSLGKGVCSKCVSKIVYTGGSVCMKCGKQLKGEGELCTDCARKKHKYVQGVALYDYGSMADSIFRFKYSGRQEYALFYGLDFYERYGRWLKVIRPDALVPVPLHPSKKRVRGYNQAELIAKAISKLSGIPVNVELIVRKRKTLPQKNLSGQERQNNLKKAFKIYRNDVKLITIVIVDDIYTTGSTIDAMTETLMSAGIQKVYYMALAVGRGM